MRKVVSGVVRNQPVDVISVCSAGGEIRPLRMRMEDEEHQLLVAVNRSEKEHYLPLPKAFRHVKPLELCGSYKDGKLDHHSAVVFIIKK